MRLIVPGWQGNVNVKWLRRLQIGDQPWFTREETSKYTELMADGKARGFTWLIYAKSVITFPCPEKPLKGAGLYEIRGLAWSGKGRIARGRCIIRRRRQLDPRTLAGAGVVQGADALHHGMALGRQASPAAIARGG